jgi:hypothetical protein
MQRKLVYVLAVGAILMGVTGWLTFPSRIRSVSETSKVRYVYCPDCEREQTYTPTSFDNPCLYCEKRLVGTEESIKLRGGAPNPYGRMFVFLYVELLILMAAFWFVSRKRPGQNEEDYLYMNCEKCRQKIRYLDNKIGQVAICRRCKHCFHYPEEE